MKTKAPMIHFSDVELFEAIKYEIDQNERKIMRNMRIVLAAMVVNLVGTAYVAYRLYYGLLNAWG